MALGVSGKWGWTFIIGWLLIVMSWRPVLFSGEHFQPLYSPLHISVIVLFIAGITVIVSSVSVASKRYWALKRRTEGEQDGTA